MRDGHQIEENRLKQEKPNTYRLEANSTKQYYDTRWYEQSKRKIKLMHIDRKGRSLFITSSIIKIRRNMLYSPKIIDLGCGSGWLTKTLSKYGQVVGVDLSTRVAKDLYPDLKFIGADIISDEIDGTYDIVVSSEVIEHLTTESQYIFVKKCHKLLNANGFLILTTPNKPFTQKLYKELPKLAEQQQPIENWLNKISLVTLLDPYFKIEFIRPILFHSFFLTKLIRKYRLLLGVASLVPFSLYEFIDKLIGSSDDGLRLGVIAQKAKLARSYTEIGA